MQGEVTNEEFEKLNETYLKIYGEIESSRNVIKKLVQRKFY